VVGIYTFQLGTSVHIFYVW